MVLRMGRRLEGIMFMNTRVVDLYLGITTGPLNRVCNLTKFNYSHALHLINMWDSMGLIKLNKSGFRYNIFYTSRGSLLADNLRVMKKYLMRAKIQW
jgi:hypothetical protein